MVPSLRIEIDPSPAIPRPESRTGSSQATDHQGFSDYLNAAKPAETNQKAPAVRVEDRQKIESTPKAESQPEPKAEPGKASVPEAPPKALEKPEAQPEAEAEPEVIPPQPIAVGLEAALVPPLPNLPPAGVVPPEEVLNQAIPELAPKAIEAAAVALADPLPRVASGKGEPSTPTMDATASVLANPVEASTEAVALPTPPFQAAEPKAAAAPPLPKAFTLSEQLRAESPSVAFTLPAASHPLVREMMAQVRPEPEVIKFPLQASLEPKRQPDTKALVDPAPPTPANPEARPEEAPASPSPAVREPQNQKANGPEGGLSHTTLRLAVASPGSEGLPTPPVAQPLGTPSTPTATLTAPATVATAPHPAAVQVEGGIRWLLTKERSGAELQLHPESLGRITIQLRVDKGEVHARVWATEPATLPLLQDHKAFLEISLRQQGLSLGSFDLQQGQRGGHFQADPSGWQGNGTSVSGIAGLPSGQDSPAAITAPSAYRGLIEVFA